MAMQYGPMAGVSEDDIRYASARIAGSTEAEIYEGASLPGPDLNQWQIPITEYGCDPPWVVNLKASPYIGEIDFGRKEWARSRDAVDEVMKLLLKELRVKASTDYEHLRIDSYIRQGSSRDGLKVIKPDEFDTVLEFHIERLQLSEQHIYINGKYIPGFCYLQVDASGQDLQGRFPKLWLEGLFEERKGNVYLSSRMIHQGVFESLIDKSCRAIEEKIKAMQRSRKVNFHITRKMNPPAVNITIHLDDDANDLFMRQGQIRNPSDIVREIDLDIVPAIRLRVDSHTIYNGSPFNAKIHAVCKWKEEDAKRSLEIADQVLVWHINSAGYERRTLDVARIDNKQIFILTALRILKTYFTKTKTISKSENRPPPPIVTVLKSYHLKQIALYVIMYTCHIYPGTMIHGVKRALTFVLSLLHASLEKKHLPHFFYSNSRIGRMFPNYPSYSGALRYDLYRNIPSESLNQAELSFKSHLLPDIGFTMDGDDEQELKVKREFSNEIGNGFYF